MRIRLYGTVRHIVRQSTMEVSLPTGTTVRDTLDLLVARFGPAFAQKVLRSDGRLQTFVRLYLGENEIDDNLLDTTITPLADEIPELTLYVIMAQEGGD